MQNQTGNVYKALLINKIQANTEVIAGFRGTVSLYKYIILINKKNCWQFMDFSFDKCSEIC